MISNGPNIIAGCANCKPREYEYREAGKYFENRSFKTFNLLHIRTYVGKQKRGSKIRRVLYINFWRVSKTIKGNFSNAIIVSTLMGPR